MAEAVENHRLSRAMSLVSIPYQRAAPREARSAKRGTLLKVRHDGTALLIHSFLLTSHREWVVQLWQLRVLGRLERERLWNLGGRRILRPTENRTLGSENWDLAAQCDQEHHESRPSWWNVKLSKPRGGERKTKHGRSSAFHKQHSLFYCTGYKLSF